MEIDDKQNIQNIYNFKNIKKNSLFVCIWILPKTFIFNKLSKIKNMKYFKTLLLVKSRKYKPDTLVLKLHGHYKCVTSLDFSSCGNYIATGSGDNLAIIYCINLYDIRFKKKILTFKDATNWIYSLCFSHDDKYFATGSIDKISRIYEIDLVEGKQIIKFSFADHLKNISTVKFNSNPIS